MIRIAVCDDDKDMTVQIEKEINAQLAGEKDCEYTIETMTDGNELIQRNEVLRYDIMLLDIEMPGVSGFEIVKRFREANKNQLVIFISDHDQLVYESFQYAPFRFIRKSCLKSELGEALKKAKEQLRERSQKCLFEINGKSQYISLMDVLYFEASSHYAVMHFCDAREPGKIRITMKELYKKVQRYDFAYVHAAFIVNMGYIQEIKNGSKLLLSDGTVIPVSRRYKEQTRTRYMEYLERL